MPGTGPLRRRSGRAVDFTPYIIILAATSAVNERRKIRTEGLR